MTKLKWDKCLSSKKLKRSIADENEWRQNDRAARFLQRAEGRAQSGRRINTKRQRERSAPSIAP